MKYVLLEKYVRNNYFLSNIVKYQCNDALSEAFEGPVFVQSNEKWPSGLDKLFANEYLTQSRAACSQKKTQPH